MSLFAADPDDGTVLGIAFKPVINAIFESVSVPEVVNILAYGAGICMALVFLWWGVRKVTQMVMSAFRSGRLSV